MQAGVDGFCFINAENMVQGEGAGEGRWAIQLIAHLF